MSRRKTFATNIHNHPKQTPLYQPCSKMYVSFCFLSSLPLCQKVIFIIIGPLKSQLVTSLVRVLKSFKVVGIFCHCFSRVQLFVISFGVIFLYNVIIIAESFLLILLIALIIHLIGHMRVGAPLVYILKTQDHLLAKM